MVFLIYVVPTWAKRSTLNMASSLTWQVSVCSLTLSLSLSFSLSPLSLLSLCQAVSFSHSLFIFLELLTAQFVQRQLHSFRGTWLPNPGSLKLPGQLMSNTYHKCHSINFTIIYLCKLSQGLLRLKEMETQILLDFQEQQEQIYITCHRVCSMRHFCCSHLW